jgi:hypothetical protein
MNKITCAGLLLLCVACRRDQPKEIAMAETSELQVDTPPATPTAAPSPTAAQPAATAAPSAAPEKPKPAAQPVAAPAQPTPAAPAPALSPSEAAAITQATSNLGLVVYASKGQSEDQQAVDKKACYDWAKSQTGVDPATVAVNADSAAAAGKAAADTATQGAGVKGAARGAAGGAVVGGIAGDAGTGAAIGAVAGVAKGRRAKKQASQQAQQQAVAGAEGEAAGKIDAFKKGMSACLEGKGYSVK